MTAKETTTDNQNYGIRISLPKGDPFGDLVGTDWQNEHWFDTAADRDSALRELFRWRTPVLSGSQTTG